MAKQINILSIDPSTTCCGYAVLCCDSEWKGENLLEKGNIQPPKKMSIFDKRDMLRDYLLPIISDYPIDCVFIEKAPLPYKCKFSRSIAILQATIVFLYDNARNQLSPGQVFGACAQTWKGSEGKPITLRNCNYYFKTTLDVEVKGDTDIADAIMMGQWFIERMRLKKTALLPFHLSTC